MEIRPAGVEDVGLLLSLVAELAEFSQLAHTMSATEDDLRRSMFGTRPYAEALIADIDGVAVGFAVYFHTFSTFLGKPGLYLEDLFVLPTHRRGGLGKRSSVGWARLLGSATAAASNGLRTTRTHRPSTSTRASAPRRSTGPPPSA